MRYFHTKYKIQETPVGMIDFSQRKEIGHNKRCKNACGKELNKKQTSFCSVQCQRDYMKRIEGIRIQVHLANKAIH